MPLYFYEGPIMFYRLNTKFGIKMYRVSELFMRKSVWFFFWFRNFEEIYTFFNSAIYAFFWEIEI